MKVVIKNSNSNLFINNYKIFCLKQNVKMFSKEKSGYNNFFIGQCKNYLLLFKNYYYTSVIFNNIVTNNINFYILLNNVNNYYLIIKNGNFECVYSLAYKIISSTIIKYCIKVFFTSKFAVCINLLTCLTKKFVIKA